MICLVIGFEYRITNETSVYCFGTDITGINSFVNPRNATFNGETICGCFNNVVGKRNACKTCAKGNVFNDSELGLVDRNRLFVYLDFYKSGCFVEIAFVISNATHCTLKNENNGSVEGVALAFNFFISPISGRFCFGICPFEVTHNTNLFLSVKEIGRIILFGKIESFNRTVGQRTFVCNRGCYAYCFTEN